MHRLLSRLAVLTCGLAVLSQSASGQTTLRERIDALRAQKAREAAEQKLLANPQTRILQALLFTKLTVDFQETPARAAFEFLRTTLDVNMVVRWLDDPAGYGLDPETPITLAATDMLALDVLELLIEQSATMDEATWQLRDSFLEVGTKERLSVPAARTLRIYPVDALLFEPTRFEDAPQLDLRYNYAGPWGADGAYAPYGLGYATGGTGSIGVGNVTQPGDATNSKEAIRARGQALVDAIVQTIEPDAWVRHGGEWASIQLVNGALVVRAPDYVLRQIGGYPPVPPPRKSRPAADRGQSPPSP